MTNASKKFESIVHTHEFDVLKETEKAVMVHFHDFSQAPWFDGDDNRWDRDVWLPKSQIKIENGVVVEIAGWLAKKHNILTHEERARLEKLEREMTTKYEAVIERAKAAGIKGVRKGMRYTTILAKAAEQHIAFAI